MTDEQRLQAITEQLLLVRDNLFRGMSKSMQKLQAQSINEVLELPKYAQSPEWMGLTHDQKQNLNEALNLNGRFAVIDAIEAVVKGNNT